MSIPEANTLAELIDDCTALPEELTGTGTTTPEPGAAAPWRVDESNYAQVVDLDAYV
ncbi:hypothetical protein [Saccharothrix lopnurensis]|uniref:Uncharacterized protein n=1 Tax=Saccharothrix lopnurensis TaxID=1670621 RepID=A0ABW1P485_9PSEU